MADQQGGTIVGGVRDIDANANDLQVESLARFAVDEHNKNEVRLILPSSFAAFIILKSVWLMIEVYLIANQ